jgi:excisionase family DNA binding protein
MAGGGELLTVRQVALILNVSPKSIYAWIRQKKLRAVRLARGRTVRVHRTDVERFIDDGRTSNDDVTP